MAGTIVHLVIADMLSQGWKNGEVVTPYGRVKLVRDYFIAGNICPDGIQSRKDYNRDMKKHTHFRDGIMDCDFHKEENLVVFRQRLSSFIKKNLDIYKDDSMRSLYLGYLVHMLADEMFMLKIRPVFFKNIAVKGLTEFDMESFRYFSSDVNMIDFRLVNEYEGAGRIYNALSGIKPYVVDGMVTEKELTESRRWILDYFFRTGHKNPGKPVYLSYELMWDFIVEVVEKVGSSIMDI